jgi:hypothetical protein
VLAEPNASVANEDMQFGNIQLHLGKHFDLGLICCVFDPINFVLVEPLLKVGRVHFPYFEPCGLRLPLDVSEEDLVHEVPLLADWLLSPDDLGQGFPFLSRLSHLVRLDFSFQVALLSIDK